MSLGDLRYTAGPGPALQERARSPALRLGLQARSPARRERVPPPLHDRPCVLSSRPVARSLLLAGPRRAAVVERILAVVDGRPVLLSEVAAVPEGARGHGARGPRRPHRRAAHVPRGGAPAPGRADARTRSSAPSRACGRACPRQRRTRRSSSGASPAARPRSSSTWTSASARRCASARRRCARPTRRSATRPGASFEQAAPAIRASLDEKTSRARIEDWVKELRRSAEIRYNLESPAARAGTS